MVYLVDGQYIYPLLCMIFGGFLDWAGLSMGSNKRF